MKKCRVLVTGASAGLGLHLSKKFENEGHFVLRHEGRSHFDLRNLSDVTGLILLAKDQEIDVLINNAAVTCPGKALQEYAEEEIVNMLNVNLVAPILLTHGLLNQLKSVININSMVGLEVKPKRTLYSSTKWGLRGFSQSLSAENEEIHILDVYPTNIKTSPERLNAMDLNFVLDEIYNAFLKKEKRLVLDGRK